MAKKESPFEEVVSRARKFVEKQKGRWDHDSWEKLVKDVSHTGIEMSDDTRRHLGNMLESVKHFYTELSNPKAKSKKAGAKKTEAKKPKAKSKKKSAAKKSTDTKKKSPNKKRASS